MNWWNCWLRLWFCQITVCCVLQEQKPAAVVKIDLWSTEWKYVIYVMSCLQKNTRKVRNIKAYLQTALYNAPATMINYYQQEVNHDLNGAEQEWVCENCKKLENKLREKLTSEQEILLEACLAEFLIKDGCEQKEYFLMDMATGMRMMAERL